MSNISEKNSLFCTKESLDGRNFWTDVKIALRGFSFHKCATLLVEGINFWRRVVLVVSDMQARLYTSFSQGMRRSFIRCSFESRIIMILDNFWRLAEFLSEWQMWNW